jgi:hypothetical protein
MVPALGMVIPYVAGVISYSTYVAFELVATFLFFILTSFVIWIGSSWVHHKLRPLFTTGFNPFTKLAAVVTGTAVYGACIAGLSGLTWYKLSGEVFNWSAFYRFFWVCILVVIVFTLVYEIIFLTNERKEDSRLVEKMDKELTQAELQALTNEMDPHFIFNSLNAMNYLILNNPNQAYLFNNHLAQVYKYFLLNKNRKLISLEEELDFLNSYFFLLDIRYDKNVGLDISLDKNKNETLIPPCAMQVLVENAIKHNHFSDKDPLTINIRTVPGYIEVVNKVRLKSYPHNSTNIGLRNLSLRFKLICERDIIIENSPEHFLVKLPLIHQSKIASHDQSNYY